MDVYGSVGFGAISSAAKKKRSNATRRPRNDPQPFTDYHDVSSLSSTPPSESVSKVSSDENIDSDLKSWRKEISINQYTSNSSYINTSEAGFCGSFHDSNEQRRGMSDSKRSSKGVLTPSNWKGRDTRVSGNSSSGQSVVVPEGLSTENTLKKVKLKVGGVTRIIHAHSTSDGTSVHGSSSAKSSRSSDASQSRQKLILQESSDEDQSFKVRKADSSRGKVPEESATMKQTDHYEPVRKSKRVPKRRIIDGALDDGDGYHHELRYLERLRTSKVTAEYGATYEEDEGEISRKRRRISRVLNTHGADDDSQYDVDAGGHGASRSGKDSKRLGKSSEDIDYEEEEEEEQEEEEVSDGHPETNQNKPRKDLVDFLGASKKVMAVTTRQRALQSGKDVTSNSGASLIEFPNGLTPTLPKKQKEKLSEVEQQLKKAEAAQRRRMQVEKAARESEAEAIRKILGQDSSRKKREDKIKKRQEELAQEKAANAMILASNTVRWVHGPAGTVVTFPDEMGLPSIFEPKPSSYPPPREKCAGPSCLNPYKYRDSKSKLPLCSLQCYKAIQEKMHPVPAC